MPAHIALEGFLKKSEKNKGSKIANHKTFLLFHLGKTPYFCYVETPVLQINKLQGVYYEKYIQKYEYHRR
jgi:hypothetical protein